MIRVYDATISLFSVFNIFLITGAKFSCLMSQILFMNFTLNLKIAHLLNPEKGV